MLSTAAFNALLKTLEEPPAHVIFILATTEIQKVPATILSRCQRHSFKRIPVDTIAARLNYVAQQEHLNLQPDAAALLARMADGGMRDALTLLDQCSGSDVITTETVISAMGLAGNLRTAQLHWWDFMALFRSLPDECRICKIISYRTEDLTDMPKGMREQYEKLRRVYALPAEAGGTARRYVSMADRKASILARQAEYQKEHSGRLTIKSQAPK